VRRALLALVAGGLLVGLTGCGGVPTSPAGVVHAPAPPRLEFRAEPSPLPGVTVSSWCLRPGYRVYLFETGGGNNYNTSTQTIPTHSVDECVANPA
jgi:hypothetical protein